jgi:NTE family protein
VVDGGLLSNFPVWLFDVDCKPRWPTFGFKLVEPDAFHACSGKTGAVSFLLDIIATMIEGNDTMYIKNKDMVRTVPIPTIGVGAIDFDISREKSQMLFQSGYDSGCSFLDNWNFEKYINKYRTNKEFSRTKSLWAE